MKKGYSFRKFVNDLHLWLGLASGIVLFIVCLSGTIYTFHTEVEEWLEPAKYSVDYNGKPALSTDVLLPLLEKELKGKITSLEIPASKEKPYRISVKKEDLSSQKSQVPANESGTSIAKKSRNEHTKAQPSGDKKGQQAGHGGGRGKTYLIDQYTGAVKGTTEGPASKFFLTMMQLHRWLLIEGGVGKMIVGVCTIIFILMIISGLVLWIPSRLRNLKNGFRIKTRANWKRINHDLHNTLGFYSSFLLLIMALTGLCWSFEWYKNGLSKLLGDEVFKQRKEKPVPIVATGVNADALPLSKLIQTANAVLPYEGSYKISIPADSTSAVVFAKTKEGFFALSAADKVQLDPFSGKALKIDRFAAKPLNEQIAATIKPLHLGEIYGTFSKILYFIACLIATSLPITGTMIWINKMKKNTRKREKRESEPSILLPDNS